MTIKTVHTVVLGAGPGGYVAAIRLAQLGIDTLLVEGKAAGGVCLNVGCIPSKALIHAASSYARIPSMSSFGVETEGRKIDFAKTQSWKNGIVKQLTSGVETLVKKNGAQMLYGQGTFKSDRQLDVVQEDGKTVHVHFTNCIIATGSRPISLKPFPIGGRIMNSTGALALEEVPKHLIIIGGGYIGLELGFVYRQLGAEVTIIEMMDTILPGFDADVVKFMTRKLKKEKFTVYNRAKANGFSETKQGLKVQLTHKDKEIAVEGSHLFVSVGRVPNTHSCGLEHSGVALDDLGFIAIDQQMRTNVPHIYAIGDVAGQPMLAHHASYQGEIAAEVIAGHRVQDQAKTCAAVVFTEPEIATVGMSEQEARDQGLDITTGTFPFAALGKAKSQNARDGFVKIIALRETEEVVGVVILGPHAGDLIGEALLGIEMGAFLDDFSLSIHPHPTLTEAIMEAAKKTKGQAIHVLN